MSVQGKQLSNSSGLKLFPHEVQPSVHAVGRNNAINNTRVIFSFVIVIYIIKLSPSSETHLHGRENNRNISRQADSILSSAR